MTVALPEERSEDSRVVSGRFYAPPEVESLAAALQQRYGSLSAADAAQALMPPLVRAPAAGAAAVPLQSRPRATRRGLGYS